MSAVLQTQHLEKSAYCCKRGLVPLELSTRRDSDMPIIYDCTVSSPGSMSSTATAESVSRASDCSSHLTSLSRTQYAKPTIVKTDIVRQPSQVDGAAQTSPLEKTLPKVWPVQLRKACQFCRYVAKAIDANSTEYESFALTGSAKSSG